MNEEKEKYQVRARVADQGFYNTNGQDYTAAGETYYISLDGIEDFCREEVEEIDPDDFEIIDG